MENMLSISQTYHYNYSQNGNDVIYNIMPDKATLSEEDRASYNAYQAVYRYSALFWYPLFIVIAAILFYRWKLKKPLAILQNASQKIADNDWDFQIEYSGQDELAKLCSAFEAMRNSVQQNHIAM